MISRIAFIIAAVGLLAASCASTSSESQETTPSTLATTTSTSSTTTSSTTTSTTEAPSSFPVTIEAPNGPVTIEERPERIVSISPTSTEVLFAVGAGDQVVAVDSLSTYPEDAPVTDLAAFPAPSVEAIASFDPDLVFLSFDPNQDVIPGLAALGVPAILHPTAVDLADAYSQWEQVGAATGHLAEAAQLVADTQADLDALYETVPAEAVDLTYYYELTPDFFSLTSSTFVGELLVPTGMTNIADTEDPDGFGFPQLTAEFIVGSDPDLVLLADTKCCAQTSETVAERPGWDSMTAVIQDQVVELDDDIASRWGPRIAVLVEDVVAAILSVELADA
ncbi:MAG: helical backbone metal receptor [Acidimicrobiia bacterium]|nr:helical backbone metal receptor [Acidimicrobiia bacterium]